MPTFLDDFRDRWQATERLVSQIDGEPMMAKFCEMQRESMCAELLALVAAADRADFPQDLIDAAKIVCGKESG